MKLLPGRIVLIKYKHFLVRTKNLSFIINNSQIISLPDGRRLSYLEFGDADGHPVFYFHGSPSSYFEPLLIGEEIFREHNLRIIAVNRPGIGNSDFQKKRSFKTGRMIFFFLLII